MKQFSFLRLTLPFAAFTIMALSSCQKEQAQSITAAVNPVAPDRSPTGIIYGAELYQGAPSNIVGLDQATGIVVSLSNAFYIDPANNNIALDDIKGICLSNFNGAHFLTTGNPANPTLGPTSPYNDALFKVNPATGQCSYLSTSPFGTVSDLEFDVNAGVFYGLRGNTNTLITISDAGNNFGNYAATPISGIAAGYTLKGLTLVHDNAGTYLVGCATSNNAVDPARLYRLPLGGGLIFATQISTLAPVGTFSAGHCGIGFDQDINLLLINRTTGTGNGLNSLNWTNPLANPALTGFWGGQGYNFEDLSSFTH